MRAVKSLWFLSVLAIVMALLPLGSAFAQTIEVGTAATVTGTGAPPVVEFKWELPDMNPGVAGVQFGTAGNAHQHDDDMTLSGVQFAPWLEDMPEARLVQYWFVANDPNGVDDIVAQFVRVFHPAGDLKYQLEATRVACDAPFLQAALEAAEHTGQIPAGGAANIFYTNCTQPGGAIFMVQNSVSKHQPCGFYRVDAYAQDRDGAVGVLSNFMFVIPVVGLMTDFTTVNWGEMKPGLTKWIQGDITFGTAAAPTVKNVGNTFMNLNIRFSNLVGTNLGKIVNTFDARLGILRNNVWAMQTIDPIMAGTTATFGAAGMGLGSNEVAKLDLSVHPPLLLPADTYTGTIFLSGTSQGCLSPCPEGAPELPVCDLDDSLT